MSFKVPEQYRITSGNLASTAYYGNNGCFIIALSARTSVVVIASDGGSWEHVSVHCESDGKSRTPTWDEMCRVKKIFWDEEDCVIQYHPSKSEYVNNHPHTLHLWRPTKEVIPIPPKIFVGI